MWLYVVGIALLILGLAGTAVGGGIFTIVLIPIGVVIVVSAVAYGMLSRSSEGAAGAETDAHPDTGRPLPHHPRRETGHATTSPEALADARRTQQ